MNKPDRSEIIKSALCSAGCGAPWKKWHRQCNLVFCDVHANDHECKPVGTRIFPEQKQLRKRKSKVVQEVKPQDLFAIPGNGNGSQIH